MKLFIEIQETSQYVSSYINKFTIFVRATFTNGAEVHEDSVVKESN